MPAPPTPDNAERSAPAERFNPSVLDRMVIAEPLLTDIRNEIEGIKAFQKNYPAEAKEFNSFIFLPEDSDVTSSENRARLRKVIAETAANAAPNFAKSHRTGKRVPDTNAVFAWLDARTVRRILNRQKGWLRKAEQSRRSKRIAPTGEPAIMVDRIFPSRFEVIIDLNLEFMGQRAGAYEWVKEALALALEEAGVEDPGQVIDHAKSEYTNQYVFATLQADVISRLVEMDAAPIEEKDLARKSRSKLKALKIDCAKQLLKKNTPTGQKRPALDSISAPKFRAIYRIWRDFEVQAQITRSISTVKANAAINSFAARGKDLTWAVIDTGIQGDHPHFEAHQNLHDPKSPMHRDFTSSQNALEDRNGHGTHVAGIIAGEWIASRNGKQKQKPLTAISRYLDEHGDEQQKPTDIGSISGMAPECRLVSLKVLDENGIGNASNLIAAIAYVQEINGRGRRILIHGVNISIGYDFDPKWFACGQSPLCVEVDQLVKSGVVVVVAAGNTGYGAVNNGSSSAGLTVTINDPGNADLAITVGATHRDMPHTYGVSYFSSKGPTGDGRLKPDLVAPGEKIISCASSYPDPGKKKARIASELKHEVANSSVCDYVETSGTSMAAPHVSGLVAAFLSVRREFIGQPEKVKQIFLSTCTDLRRDRYFQGAGLIDLMRAIQSV